MHSARDRYPSRIGGSEQIMNRLDPVLYPTPEFGPPPILSQEQLQCYERDGFLILPDYLPRAVAPLLAEIQRLKRADAVEEVDWEAVERAA